MGPCRDLRRKMLSLMHTMATHSIRKNGMSGILMWYWALEGTPTRPVVHGMRTWPALMEDMNVASGLSVQQGLPHHLWKAEMSPFL